MSAAEIYTLGVYGSDEERFFGILKEKNIRLFCDVRARRGVRGARYAFVNSKRLQARLAEMKIKYVHRKDLAPSPEVRSAQWEQDKLLGIGKRSRTELGEVFKTEYHRQVLAGLDAESLLEELEAEAGPIAFFCVEQNAAACHRSLLTEAIRSQTSVDVIHLEP